MPLSWLHQNGAEKHSLVMEIPIGATVITIGDHGEGLQVLHYEEGQKYEPHYDYFVDEFNTKNGGQRMATMLMTDVEEGGETVFPAANMNFSSVPWYNVPRMGDALLFWSMRPDAMLDPSSLHEGTSGHLPDFRPTVDNKPPSKGKNRTGIIVGVIVGLGLLSILAGVELLSMEIKPFTFTYSELKSATQDFNLSNKLEEGGFEPVYKVQTQMIQFSLKSSQVVDLLLRNLSSGSYHFTRLGESVQALGYSLSVYAWIDQDVGYCQGMSDLCSPMIVLLEDEADSFFCFERLMRRLVLRGNFRSTGRSVGVEAQLTHLSSITQIIDPKLHQHLGITTTTTSSLPLYISWSCEMKINWGEVTISVLFRLFYFIHMSAYKDDSSDSDENCRVTTEGTLTRRFWRVNTRVVVKVTLAARILTLSVTVERREEVRVDPPTNVVRKKSGTNMMNKEQVGRRGMILMLPSLNLRMRNNSCAANDDKIRKEMWTMWNRVF
ncbi:LOW QUALITY PROTEIN: hypothetical protein HID58_013128 [Brassica napus]|uniref:Procollagen-proline 4-dioxygenase n=1 Tax=Brassica napus TaxID=3708 RepID=A0ABQ8E322_BRANA|nr:LOW QUALITY PROTEIN: hypothetical protein HID58_013128 [Brassica napus]